MGKILLIKHADFSINSIGSTIIDEPIIDNGNWIFDIDPLNFSDTLPGDQSAVAGFYFIPLKEASENTFGGKTLRKIRLKWHQSTGSKIIKIGYVDSINADNPHMLYSGIVESNVETNVNIQIPDGKYLYYQMDANGKLGASASDMSLGGVLSVIEDGDRYGHRYDSINGNNYAMIDFYVVQPLT